MIIDKKFLKEHAEHRKELRDELQRYELTNGVSYYGNSPSNIDGMPHSHSTGNTTMDKVICKHDTETYIDKLESLINTEEQQIEEILKKMIKAKEKFVIRLKYYHCMEWDDVADQMLKEVCKVAPELFQKAGPSCAFGACSEGSMSCGKALEMKEKYKKILGK